MRNFKDKQYIEWRKAVKKRDGYCCRWPHCRATKKLQIHHILPWCHYPGLRFDINNGITLCKYHHNLIKNDEMSYCNYFFKSIKLDKK